MANLPTKPTPAAPAPAPASAPAPAAPSAPTTALSPEDAAPQLAALITENADLRSQLVAVTKARDTTAKERDQYATRLEEFAAFQKKTNDELASAKSLLDRFDKERLAAQAAGGSLRRDFRPWRNRPAG